VIKLDIVNAVVAKTLISRTKAEQAVETVFESLKQALGRGQRIELRRFGVFSVKPRKTGIGRNPRTGEEVSIPPRQSRPLQTRQRTSRHRGGKKAITSRRFKQVSLHIWPLLGCNGTPFWHDAYIELATAKRLQDAPDCLGCIAFCFSRSC